MRRRKGQDRVSLPDDCATRLDFGYRHRISEPLAENFGPLQEPRSACGSPHTQRLRPALQLHRAHEADRAEHVIGMEMREENVAGHQRDPVPHHLSLGPFAAVEQESLTVAHERDRRDVALYGRPRGGGAEKPQGQRHWTGI